MPAGRSEPGVCALRDWAVWAPHCLCQALLSRESRVYGSVTPTADVGRVRLQSRNLGTRYHGYRVRYEDREIYSSKDLYLVSDRLITAPGTLSLLSLPSAVTA